MPEVIDSSVGLVPTNALVAINLRIVGNRKLSRNGLGVLEADLN
jgi:hypothetical protein